MQEREVTIGRTTYDMESPFFVIATQNPIEQEGTYPLPEAQLDRFLFKIAVPFTTRPEMNTIVERTTTGREDAVRPIGRVWPLTVTEPSCIASRSADWLFGVARLISSARMS